MSDLGSGFCEHNSLVSAVVADTAALVRVCRIENSSLRQSDDHTYRTATHLSRMDSSKSKPKPNSAFSGYGT